MFVPQVNFNRTAIHSSGSRFLITENMGSLSIVRTADNLNLVSLTERAAIYTGKRAHDGRENHCGSNNAEQETKWRSKDQDQ